MLLVESGIAQEIVDARGYRSVDDPMELFALGFADYQCLPGLLIPEWTTAGVQRGYKLRPDNPRINEKGKPIKYESPAGSRLQLDCPPTMTHLLRDASVPLYFTEGSKKADAAASHGILCVSLSGVYGFLRDRLVLDDLDDLALNGRDAFVVYDSDVVTNPHVADALNRLCSALARRGARVWVVWLPAERDAKVGLDDYLASGGIAAGLGSLARPWDDREVQQESEMIARYGQELPPAPAWPANVFPQRVDAYISAQARAIGVPAEMVAVPMLVFAGSAVGNAVQLQLKHGWTLRPTVWAGVVAAPGEKKSPSLAAAQRPLNELQQRLHVAWKTEMASHEADVADWVDAPKDERGEKPQPPEMDHLFTTDVTVEKLVQMVAQGPGVAIIRDELSGFIGAMDKYRGSKGDDRQAYLSLWAGAPVKVDRKGGGTVFAARPVVGVYGGIQPDYVRDLHTRNGQRDGMVERFLLFRPDVPRTGWTDDEVDPALLDPVVEVLSKLRYLTAPADVGHITVELNSGAKRAFIDWYNANDAAVGGTTGLRQGFYAKLDSQVGRIALILHCLHHADDPGVLVSEATVRAAIDLAEFFRAHLDRVLPLIGDHRPDDPGRLAARVLRYLRTPDLRDDDGWVGRSVLLQKLNCTAEDLSEALGDLQRRGAVESRTVGTATKPAEQWRLLTMDGSKNSNHSINPEPAALGRGDHSNSSNSSAMKSVPHDAASTVANDQGGLVAAITGRWAPASTGDQRGRVKIWPRE